MFSVAELGGSHSAAADAEARENRKALKAAATRSLGAVDDGIEERSSSDESESLDKQLTHSKAYGTVGQKPSKIAIVQGLNRPLFHVDITAALNSALANAQRKSH